MLTQQTPDMEPRYQAGEEINFNDSRDSRCFMGRGWGDTERRGVWTVGPFAELNLRLESETDQALTLRALLIAVFNSDPSSHQHSCFDRRCGNCGMDFQFRCA